LTDYERVRVGSSWATASAAPRPSSMISPTSDPECSSRILLHANFSRGNCFSAVREEGPVLNDLYEYSGRPSIDPMIVYTKDVLTSLVQVGAPLLPTAGAACRGNLCWIPSSPSPESQAPYSQSRHGECPKSDKQEPSCYDYSTGR
jgi:hypothetical protein